MRHITRALCGGLLALSVAFAAGCGGARGESSEDGAVLRSETGSVEEPVSREAENQPGGDVNSDSGFDLSDPFGQPPQGNN